MTSGDTSGGRPVRHGRRLFLIWFVLAGVTDPLFWFLVGPHLPPGTLTDSATGAVFDTRVLVVTALPVAIAVVMYFLYAVVVWRAPKGAPIEDGPPIRAHLPTQIAWIGGTAAIVMGLFVFGTYELVVPAGAGGGEGPSPIWRPASHAVLPIQVIGQQWKWSYRYPSFGGFETDQLVLPANTTIEIHVTSLDVIHDWWAYQLGVKADANPGVDDVAYVGTKQPGTFMVRCDELCGIWHGAMYNTGTVVSQSDFETWATQTEDQLAAETKTLPPFAYTYTPSANGAGGSYYPEQDPFSKQQQYGNGSSANG